MQKIFLAFFQACCAHPEAADGAACNIVMDCNANIEARLAALETKNEEQKIGNYSKIYIQGR